MFIMSTVLLHAHPSSGALAPQQRVVMARPYPQLIGKSQKLSPRPEQVAGVSAGEVTARCSNVRVENGITAEYIIWNKPLAIETKGYRGIAIHNELTPNLVTQMVRSMTRKM